MDQCDYCKYLIHEYGGHYECTCEMTEEEAEAIEKGEECPYRKEPKMSYSDILRDEIKKRMEHPERYAKR